MIVIVISTLVPFNAVQCKPVGNNVDTVYADIDAPTLRIGRLRYEDKQATAALLMTATRVFQLDGRGFHDVKDALSVEKL